MSNKSVNIVVDGRTMVDWLYEMLKDKGVSKEKWALIADEVLGTEDSGGRRDLTEFGEWLNRLGKIVQIYDILWVAAEDYVENKLDKALEKDYPTTFFYSGHEFVPVRQLTKKEDKTVMMDVSSKGVFLSKDEGNWDYEDFYAASTDRECDLFRLVGRSELWIPGRNMLFKYEG